MNLQRYFEDLEERIDAKEEARLEAAWRSFADGERKTGQFTPARRPAPPRANWPRMTVNEALLSDENMIYRELWQISRLLAAGGGELLSLRANFGTGILPAAIGGVPFLMPDGADTLPGLKPFADGAAALGAAMERGADFSRGYAGRVFSVAEKYLELSRPYPRVKRFLHLYGPDLQGPLSLLEAVWGSGCYYALYDDPDFFRSALGFFAALYEAYFDKWLALCPPFDGEHAVEWGCLHRGLIMLRNDSATNISGAAYRDFVRPFDARLLGRYGGGLHFCGRGHHYLPFAAEMSGLFCVNLSQPELNDMEIVYGCTVDKGIEIIGLPAEEARRARAAGRDFRGLVHVGAQISAYREENADAAQNDING